MINLPENIQKVLKENHTDYSVRVFATPTHSVQDAADALGCEQKMIVKSIVVEKKDKTLCLFLLRGDHFLDLKAIREKGIKAKRLANPERILNETGYPVGGTPPFGHLIELRTYVDKSLFECEQLWFGGGQTNMLFRINSTEIMKCCRNMMLFETNGAEVNSNF